VIFIVILAIMVSKLVCENIISDILIGFFLCLNLMFLLCYVLLQFVKCIHLTEVYHFHDMIDMLVGCGYVKGTTLFGYGYDFRQSNR
jgi:hypothetical protein